MVIEEFSFPIYGVMILLSCILGSVFNFIFLHKAKIEREKIIVFITMIITYSLFFGVVFTMIFSNAIGLSSYGGAIGVLIATTIYSKIQGWNPIYIKSSILSLPLFYSVSKLGCFFARLLLWNSLYWFI